MSSLLGILKRRISLAYNKVYVIQSLREGERRTGEDLLDAFQYQLLEKGPYHSEIIDVQNKNDFIMCLKEIATKAQQGESPILHLEIHGASTGLELTNGDFLPWQEVADAIRPINIGCRNNLLVTLAVCSGSHLWTTHDIKRPAAFFGLIGATGTLFDTEIVPLFASFYRLMLVTDKHDEAIKGLLDANLKSGAKFQFQVSENLFLEEIQSINNRTLDYDRFSQFQGKSPSREERRRNQKQHKKNVLKVVRTEFYKFKRIFFMEDLYPENRERFNFSYEDTLGFSQCEFMYHPDLPIPKNLKAY